MVTSYELFWCLICFAVCEKGLYRLNENRGGKVLVNPIKIFLSQLGNKIPEIGFMFSVL
jgi:hypothetical protein